MEIGNAYDDVCHGYRVQNLRSSARRIRGSEMMHAHLRLCQPRFLAAGRVGALVDYDLIAGLQIASEYRDRSSVVDSSDHLNLAQRPAVEDPEAGGMVGVPMLRLIAFVAAVGRKAERLQRHLQHV